MTETEHYISLTVEVCKECNEEIPPEYIDDAIPTDDGFVHLDCGFTCRRCDEYYPNSEMGYAEHCDGCSSRMFSCASCGEPTYDYDRCLVGPHTNDYVEWCEDCRDYSAFWCNRCDIYHEEGYRCGHNYVEDYSYKPSPVFYGVEFDHDFDRHMFMGFELEVEDCGGASNGTDIIRDTLGDLVYFKEDGSLEDGFEIVTHPMTLAYASSIDWSWLPRLRDNGYRSWDTSTCGLHVHVDKRAFSGRKHQYAFTLLLMRNRSLSYLISGRQGNHYAQFDKDIRLEIPKYMKNKPNDLQRYSAVNVLNRATIEVRMFRGSLKRERILSALEYVHSAVDYTRYVKSGNTSKEYLTSPAFIQWIRANADKYPNLTEYINNSTEFGFNDRAQVEVDYRGE